MKIEILSPITVEYKRLETVAKLIELQSYNGKLASDFITCEVKDIYFDAGQDWWWTTIVATRNGSKDSWQMLYPNVWETICKCDDPQGLCELAEHIVWKQTDLIWKY